MFNRLAFAAAAAVLTATPASAATIVGTFGASIVGVAADTPSIGLDTTFTNSLFSIVGSATGDLSVLPGSFFTVSPVKATTGTNVSFNGAFGSFLGTVNMAAVGGTLENRTVSVFALGTFTPAGALSSFSAGASSLTFSFTQTGGPNSAVSGSFSLASPPADVPEIPEPATWALMIGGFGLVGGMARRRVAARVTFA